MSKCLVCKLPIQDEKTAISGKEAFELVKNFDLFKDCFRSNAKMYLDKSCANDLKKTLENTTLEKSDLASNLRQTENEEQYASGSEILIGVGSLVLSASIVSLAFESMKEKGRDMLLRGLALLEQVPAKRMIEAQHPILSEIVGLGGVIVIAALTAGFDRTVHHITKKIKRKLQTMPLFRPRVAVLE